jgi:hypothetical protein
MVVGDVVDYLREHLALGYDPHELKLQLVRFGHSPKTVEEASDILRREALASLPAPAVPVLRSPSIAHFWLLAPVVLFVLMFSVGVVVSLLRAPLI